MPASVSPAPAPEAQSRAAKAARWAQKGIWSVMDQALFAGANFVVNVLLARWLSPEAYGAYTVAFTVFLLFSTLHQGMLTEPMLVFGPGKFKSRLPQYFGTLLRGHLGISVIGFLVLGAGALGTWLFDGPLALTVGLLAIAIAQGGILLTWITRSMQYVTFNPQRSAVAGAIYAVLLLGGVAALYAAGVLGTVEVNDVLLAVGVTGIAGLLSGLWLIRRGGLWPLPAPEANLVRSARASHVEYGRWAVATGGLDWVAGYLPIMWLSFAGGLAEAGGLRALYNFALPAVHVFQVLGTLMVPTFVQALERGRGRSALAALTGVAVTLAAIYGAVLLFLGQPALNLIYDGKFDGYADLMWAVALVPIGIGIVVVLLSCLRAMERPRQLFWARTGALVLTVAPLAALGGITTTRTALLAIVAISVVSALAMGFDALRNLSSGASGPGPGEDPPDGGEGPAGTPEGDGLASTLPEFVPLFRAAGAPPSPSPESLSWRPASSFLTPPPPRARHRADRS